MIKMPASLYRNKIKPKKELLLHIIDFSIRHKNSPFLLSEVNLFPQQGRILTDSGVFKTELTRNKNHEFLAYSMACSKQEAMPRIEAYLERQAAKQREQYLLRKAREKEQRHEAAIRKVIRPQKPEEIKSDGSRAVRLTDRHHWQHGNLAQPRTASSLGGNSFAYYG